MIETGKTANHSVEDYVLTRYAYLLIAQNSGPRKQEIIKDQMKQLAYEICEAIEIRIDIHTLMVSSFPVPDCSIKLNNLQQGRTVSRRYRNRRICEFLANIFLWV